MKYLRQLLKERSILIILLPFLLTILLLIISYGKGPAHLWVNQWHSPATDVFFKYFTHFGDGAMFAIVIIILLFIRLRWALYQAAAALMTLVFVFIAKQLLFKGMPRPSKYFENEEVLHLVEGVKMHAVNTFPSGHTITAFAIFIILALIVSKTSLKIIFTLTAILAGFSRVYLSQHFLEDILTGALIGIAIAVLSCTLIDKLSIFKKPWVDLSLVQILKGRNES